MTFFWYVLAFIVGLCVAIQPPTNAAAARLAGVGPMLIVTNTAVLIGAIILYFLWPEKANWSAVSQVPLRYWLGALYGLTIVVGGMLVFPKIGPTTALGLILLGQFILGALIEQQGWLGIPKTPLDWTKMVGIGLMLFGFLVTQARNFFPAAE